MPKLLQINSVVNWGSTGRLAEYLLDGAKARGWETYFAYGRHGNKSGSKTIRIGSDLGVKINALKARIFDNEGFNAKKSTQNLIKQIEKISPDIIHIHNLHGYYLNVPALFEYLNSSGIPALITMHDCWTFTGHCTYFDSVECQKWKAKCGSCPLSTEYPSSLFLDGSGQNFERKIEIFSKAKNLTLVPVSRWLEGLVKESKLSGLPIKMIHNGIDLSNFQAFSDTTKIAAKYGLEGKKIILGVASVWSARKGLADFVDISKKLPPDYKIVLVGLSEKQKSALTENILGLQKTENIAELCAFYTLANVFANPTYEDNLPTVNIEAQACGTPVATYNTGGSPECVNPEFGACVPKGDKSAMLDAILKIASKNKSESSQPCIDYVHKNFSKDLYVNKYMELYETLSR